MVKDISRTHFLYLLSGNPRIENFKKSICDTLLSPLPDLKVSSQLDMVDGVLTGGEYYVLHEFLLCSIPFWTRLFPPCSVSM